MNSPAQARRLRGQVTSRPLKGFEDMRHDVGRYRCAAVLHLEDRLLAAPSDADLDASGAVNDRVPDEIGCDLCQAIGIPGA